MAQDWIPDAELDVLKLLWSEHPLTARQITVEVYGEATPSNIGTVQKLLQRLEVRSCVERDRTEHVHRFSPGVSQTDVAASQLELLAEKVADGSLAPFVTHLVKARRLSRKEKAEIRRLLEEE
jgi:predicted transcriptional regulator